MIMRNVKIEIDNALHDEKLDNLYGLIDGAAVYLRERFDLSPRESMVATMDLLGMLELPWKSVIFEASFILKLNRELVEAAVARAKG